VHGTPDMDRSELREAFDAAVQARGLSDVWVVVLPPGGDVQLMDAPRRRVLRALLDRADRAADSLSIEVN
jgi:hypothetical protein